MVLNLFNGSLLIGKDKWVFIKDGTSHEVNQSDIEELWQEVNTFLHKIFGFHFCDTKNYFCEASDLKDRLELEDHVYEDAKKLGNTFPNENSEV